MRSRLSRHLKHLTVSIVLLGTAGVLAGTTGVLAGTGGLPLGVSIACGCESGEEVAVEGIIEREEELFDDLADF